ncbi:hypothetical protein OOT00_10880 [Desulfobotulus sp. H1]|uniref:BPL/LPL catalytic domain-containing protein n=1 Tax=Desulfobotulus pelophilus TaxID=2823377 RepID=A0ABT3NAL4_9BACT|nr:hypothetical protein [Desulfobotulus pelophilus]MCW7754489.1 hypothetical protein [Desulfobotulus pelophilus]
MTIPSPSVMLWRKGLPGLAAPLRPVFYEKTGFMPCGSEDAGGWVRAGKSGAHGAVIRVCGDCGSAFDVALWLEERGLLSDWDSVLAESQSSGVGQYGRQWVSPAGNLYLVWKLPAVFSAAKGLLPIMLGAGLAEIFRWRGVPLMIKWPNDLVLENRKVGGMLIRSRGDCVLAGMGVNFVSAPSRLAIRESSPIDATSLNQGGYIFDPLEFWASSAEYARKIIRKNIENGSIYDLMIDSTQWLWRRGQAVMVYPSGGEIFPAILAGIAGDGGLRLVTEKGEQILYSGSIGPA